MEEETELVDEIDMTGEIEAKEAIKVDIGMNFRVTANQNQGGRKYMEDKFQVAYVPTLDQKNLIYAFFGIFDGHGGPHAAEFAKDNLMQNITSQKGFWSDDNECVKKAIRDGFVQTHYMMRRELDKWPKTPSGLPSTSGTTASIAFVRQCKLFIGHVGDSGIALGYQDHPTGYWRAKQLTIDHKPESSDENARIVQCGGKVMSKSGVPRVVWHRPRIGHKGPVRRSTPMDDIPFLAVARSLGDFWSYNSDQNEFVVSPEPDVSVMDIDVNTARCLIFGSDGLWNMLTCQEAVNTVYFTEKNNERLSLASPQKTVSSQMKNWINPSKRLVDRALDRWYNHNLRPDNTTVVTVVIDPSGAPKLHTCYPVNEDEDSETDSNSVASTTIPTEATEAEARLTKSSRSKTVSFPGPSRPIPVPRRMERILFVDGEGPDEKIKIVPLAGVSGGMMQDKSSEPGPSCRRSLPLTSRHSQDDPPQNSSYSSLRKESLRQASNILTLNSCPNESLSPLRDVCGSSEEYQQEISPNVNTADFANRQSVRIDYEDSLKDAVQVVQDAEEEILESSSLGSSESSTFLVTSSNAEVVESPRVSSLANSHVNSVAAAPKLLQSPLVSHHQKKSEIIRKRKVWRKEKLIEIVEVKKEIWEEISTESYMHKLRMKKKSDSDLTNKPIPRDCSDSTTYRTRKSQSRTCKRELEQNPVHSLLSQAQGSKKQSVSQLQGLNLKKRKLTEVISLDTRKRRITGAERLLKTETDVLSIATSLPKKSMKKKVSAKSEKGTPKNKITCNNTPGALTRQKTHSIAKCSVGFGKTKAGSSIEKVQLKRKTMNSQQKLISPSEKLSNTNRVSPALNTMRNGLTSPTRHLEHLVDICWRVIPAGKKKWESTLWETRKHDRTVTDFGASVELPVRRSGRTRNQLSTTNFDHVQLLGQQKRKSSSKSKVLVGRKDSKAKSVSRKISRPHTKGNRSMKTKKTGSSLQPTESCSSIVTRKSVPALNQKKSSTSLRGYRRTLRIPKPKVIFSPT